MADLQPETREVLQTEESPPISAIPVDVREICGPVRTQSLPRKATTTVTKTTTTTPLQITREDLFRATARLVSFGSDMLVAFNSGAKEDPSTMARWPQGVPLTIESVSAIWVAAQTGTGTVSAVIEKWATGE